MRRLAVVAGIATLLLSATVVMAADRPGTPDSASIPVPTATPGTAAAPGTPAARPVSATQWTAAIAPVQVTGSVTVDEAKNGDGTVTFTLNDLLRESTWSVRLESGALDGSTAPSVIASRSGDEVQRLQGDTIQILLTKSEMQRFLSARTSPGVVAVISDGAQLSVATFAGA